MDSEGEATETEASEFLQEIAYIVSDGDETTCGICHAEFLDSEDLNVHVKQVHKESASFSKVCQFCDTTYSNSDAYARHICLDHLIQLYCCRVCTKCFTDDSQWQRHERKHKSKCNTFACSQCTAIFSTSKEVEHHEILNHDNTKDGHIVSVMPHLSALLKQNTVAYLQSQDRALICTVCKFTTADVNSFLKHSTDECIVYVCGMCCYVANGKKGLNKHLCRKNKCKIPLESKSEMTTCLMCKTKVHCRQMQTHIDNCNKYKCYMCNIRFVSIDKLSLHQSKVHPIELDVLKCKFCYKEFVGDVPLEKHMKRSHSHQFILYKYKCMTCEQIFKHPQHLFTHYFMKHKDMEPYTCKICNKKFRVRKRFTLHIKLEHKSAGIVEFDEQYHVFFSEKKSENPFVPKCVIPELVPVESYKPTIKVKTQKEINADVAKSDKDGLPTETEIDEEKNLVEKPKRNLKRNGRKRKAVDLTSTDDEEVVPLSKIKKRVERKRFQRVFSTSSNRKHMNQKKQFTCKFCKVYCYTYQNYHNHIQSHNNECINCVKCSKSFKTKESLSKHMTKDHATSKLIETLRNVLERKQIETGYNDNDHTEGNFEDLTPSERFTRTIKKVKHDKQTVTATITLSDNLSAKNFIESFVPDGGDTTNIQQTEPREDGKPVVSLKHYNSPFYRKHLIEMTKFRPEPINSDTMSKLKMPQKYTAPLEEKVKLNVKLVHGPLRVSMFDQMEPLQSKYTKSLSEEDPQDYDGGDNDDDYEDRNNDIPEVAQEIMLENSDESPNPNLQAPHKIVIPKLPIGYTKIHIATLQPEAPFYKIITVKNTQNSNEAIVIDTDCLPPEKPTKKPVQNNDVISLPDGTKFVSANPLAHLLGGKPVEELLVPIKNKYYKPALKNFKGLFAEALQNLDKPSARTKKNKKKPESEEISECTSLPDKSLTGKSLPDKLLQDKFFTGKSHPDKSLPDKPLPDKSLPGKSLPVI